MILVFAYSIGIFHYPFLLLNKAEASNNYISDIKFYKDTATDFYVMEFDVNTTFQIDYGAKQWTGAYWRVEIAPGGSFFGKWKLKDNSTELGFSWWVPDDWNSENLEFSEYNSTKTFTAGNTYKAMIINNGYIYYETELGNEVWINPTDTLQSSTLTTETYFTKFGYYGYPASWPFQDNEQYYFSETPNLSLTFPEENEQEIAGDFQITGTITMPSPYTDYNYIAAAVYFENPWSEDPIDLIGYFHTPLTATSSQEFEIDVLGLPVSYPNKIKVRMELWNMKNDIISNTYTGTGWPWYFDLYTRHIGEAPTYPEFSPIWEKYLDISKPKLSEDGYYKIYTPTSKVEFIHNFPETYKIYIEQESVVKLATTTFDNINIGDTRKFEVDDIDASTSSVKWIEAIVYNPDDEEIIRALFPILGLEEGEFEDIGENFIVKALKDFAREWLSPDITFVNVMKETLTDLLKSKIPFSYYYQIKEIFYDIVPEGEPEPIPPIKIELADKEIELDIFNIDELIETEGWQDLQLVLSAGIWALLPIYVIDRIRDKTSNKSD